MEEPDDIIFKKNILFLKENNSDVLNVVGLIYLFFFLDELVKEVIYPRTAIAHLLHNLCTL